jgi:peptide/nickel transport system permease protein
LRFIFQRLIGYAVLFFVVINLDFILPRLAPGNPAEILASNGLFPNIKIQEAMVRFGLNQPLWVQYTDFLKGIFTQWPPYFGVSFEYYPQPASSIFIQRLPWSLILILSSIILGFFLSYLTVGLTSGKRGSKQESATVVSLISLHSIPVYFLGIVIVWVFAVYLRVFPLNGNVGLGAGSGLSYIQSVIWHAVLPVITLSLSVFGEFYFLLRGSVQEVLKSDFVVLAKSRGLSSRLVMFRYVLRNSLIPMVAFMSFSVASLISRDVLVESVFNYPGLGDLIVDGILNKDYPVLQAGLTYTVLMVIVGGLIGDLLLLRLDPRLRR